MFGRRTPSKRLLVGTLHHESKSIHFRLLTKMNRTRSILTFCTGALALLSLQLPSAADEFLVTSWNNSSVRSYDVATGAFVAVVVSNGSGGLSLPHSAVVGPGGDLFVTSFGTNSVKRYDSGGAYVGDFVPAGSGGLVGPTDAFFGPSGDLYVASRGGAPGIKRYDGTTGAFVDQFVGPGNGMTGTETGNFGPDGHFYLASGGTSRINRYHGESGAFLDTFVGPGSGGLNDPHDLAWGPDGHLYVTSFGNNRLKRYDGISGEFIDDFITPAGGLQSPHGIDFRPDGFIYVASFSGNKVQRFNARTGVSAGAYVTNGSGGLNGAISLTFLFEDTLNLSAQGESFSVYGATPGEVVNFTIGIDQASRPLPCNPASVLWIKRAVSIGSAPANAMGVATVNWAVPGNLHGFPIRIQAAAVQSCRTSDVHAYTLP